MSVLALAVLEDEMATTATDRKILDKLTEMSTGFAALTERVSNVGNLLLGLTSEVKDKASRSELLAIKSEFEKGLLRVEQGVEKDVDGFQSMYESVMQEMKEMREKVDALSTKMGTISSIDERLKKLEPLTAEATTAKGFVSGARWAIGIVWTLLATGVGAVLVKVFGSSGK